VLIDAHDDNEALAIAVTVDAVVAGGGTHVVAALRDLSRGHLLHYVNTGIRCVQWHAPRMITEELSSPGITDVYTELMTDGGENTYSARLPVALGPVTVEHCYLTLGRVHGVTLLAARAGEKLLVNPGWATELPAGSVLYYVSPARLSPEQLIASLAVRG
jgi:voltage-gated potassium channel